MDIVWKPYGIETPEKEFKFDPKRRWRFDYAWPAQRIAVEVEGGIWNRGRHTRGSGFLKDMEKYNEAARQGWSVYRFTPRQLETGEAQTYIEKVF